MQEELHSWFDIKSLSFVRLPGYFTLNIANFVLAHLDPLNDSICGHAHIVLAAYIAQALQEHNLKPETLLKLKDDNVCVDMYPTLTLLVYTRRMVGILNIACSIPRRLIRITIFLRLFIIFLIQMLFRPVMLICCRTK